jgi:hypothetical protein
MRAALTLLFLLPLLALAGCATVGDTSQKWDRKNGYNFGTGPLPQPE